MPLIRFALNEVAMGSDVEEVAEPISTVFGLQSKIPDPVFTLSGTVGLVGSLQAKIPDPEFTLSLSPLPGFQAKIPAPVFTLHGMAGFDTGFQVRIPDPVFTLSGNRGISAGFQAKLPDQMFNLSHVAGYIGGMQSKIPTPTFTLSHVSGYIGGMQAKIPAPVCVLNGMFGSMAGFSDVEIIPVPAIRLTLMYNSVGGFIGAVKIPDPMFTLSGMAAVISDCYDAWVMNVRTNGFGRFTNYGFNSFTELDGKYYGCTATKIYELDGPDDDGVQIDMGVTTGNHDFETDYLKLLADTTFDVEGDGYLAIEVIGDRNEHIDYVEDVRETRGGLHIIRARFAQGAGRPGYSHIQMKVGNMNGERLSIASINMNPAKLSRKR
jgi:hypothetical protein